MPDMLAPLYALPASAPLLNELAREGVVCRRAESFERTRVLDFVRREFPKWSDEAEAAFQAMPPTMYIAVEAGSVAGFACYNVTRPDYFGPTGVAPDARKRGIGRALLLQCLEALRAEGYAYAIIGGVGPVAYYERTVGATVIPGSDPGIYGGTLLGED